MDVIGSLEYPLRQGRRESNDIYIYIYIYIYYEKSVIYTLSNLIQLYRNINPERCVDLFQMDILGT